MGTRGKGVGGVISIMYSIRCVPSSCVVAVRMVLTVHPASVLQDPSRAVEFDFDPKDVGIYHARLLHNVDTVSLDVLGLNKILGFLAQ